MPLTIFKRLVIGNIVILLLVLLLGGVVSFNLQRLQRLNHEVVARNQESIFVGEQLSDIFSLLVKLDEKYFVAQDQDYLTRFHEQKSNLLMELNKFSLLLETKKQKKMLNNLTIAFEKYFSWFNRNTPGHDASEDKDFNRLIKERAPLVAAVHNNLRSLSFLARIIIAQKIKQSSLMTKQIFTVTLIITVLTLLSGIAITVLNTQSIKHSVSRLQKKTKEISQGHFEKIDDLKGPKEIQDLSLHFNTMCQRLSELDDLKSDFISHVSHELRTPLTSIKEASTMLSNGSYNNNPKKQKKLFSLIHDECQRLLRSIMRILDYSKMEARKMEYQTVELYLPDLIRKSILKLALLAQKKNIILEFVPPQSDLPKVCVDKDRIIEVLDNIVGNALKFTPERGKVKVYCEFQEGMNELLVKVEDNGPGIKLEHLQKIFYRFKQIDKDFNAQMGTGLGLSISKYIIKAHGGKIWAKSLEAQGTTISFTLPAVV